MRNANYEWRIVSARMSTSANKNAKLRMGKEIDETGDRETDLECRRVQRARRYH